MLAAGAMSACLMAAGTVEGHAQRSQQPAMPAMKEYIGLRQQAESMDLKAYVRYLRGRLHSVGTD